MKTVHTIHDLREAVKNAKAAGKKVGFVPTMGNLHDGHISLVDVARKHSDFTICSIFVNPTQFGANEDLDKYPRTLAEDQAKLEAAGLDLVFAPTVDEMYPNGTEMLAQVTVPGLSEILCGASRPNHFTGVATVVSKLFNMVQPDSAFFGEKDFQQLTVIRCMVSELAFPIEIVGVPTVREASGLAMSSRNGYLSNEDKEKAALLYQLLQKTAKQLQEDSFFPSEEAIQNLCDKAIEELAVAGFEPDYYSIRRQSDLKFPHSRDRDLVILLAAKLNGTRLIDNLKVSL